jgi:type I restriction-modification system DNA methylase subunit
VFWVPKETRWSHLQANAKQPSVGKLIDEAMAAIEVANPGLKGVPGPNVIMPSEWMRWVWDVYGR